MFWDSMFDMWGRRSVVLSLGRPASNGLPSTQAEEVIPLAEETLIVGKQTVTSGTTTVRRFVVETPVEQQVSLYDEKVIVERRKPVKDAARRDPDRGHDRDDRDLRGAGRRKSVKVSEEIVVRRERTQRVETVRDTVRRDEIEVTRSSEKRRALASSQK